MTPIEILRNRLATNEQAVTRERESIAKSQADIARAEAENVELERDIARLTGSGVLGA